MRLIAGLTPLLLAGCSVPAIESRVAPISPAALGLSELPAPTIADAWWTGFGDGQLDRTVADAIAGNPSLDAALARIGVAEATSVDPSR